MSGELCDEYGRCWDPERESEASFQPGDEGQASEDAVDPRYTSEFRFSFLPRPLVLLQDRSAAISGHTWPGSLALLSFLADNLDFIRGKRTLELGSGTGVLGVGCALLLAADRVRADGAAGSHWLTLTDLSGAVPIIRENIRLNAARRCVAQELAWGTTDVSDFGAPLDVILMADVAYLPEAHDQLAATVLALSGPGTIVLHAYTERRACHSGGLLRALSDLGFAEVDLSVSERARILRHDPPGCGDPC